jgi:hypothetical protein
MFMVNPGGFFQENEEASLKLSNDLMMNEFAETYEEKEEPKPKYGYDFTVSLTDADGKGGIKEYQVHIDSSIKLRNFETILSEFLKGEKEISFKCRSGHKIKSKKIKFYLKGFEKAFRSVYLSVEYCPECKEKEPEGPADIFVMLNGEPVAL